MSIDPHAHTVLTFQRLSKAAGAVTLLAGVLVLLGWWFNVPVLKSSVPGLTTMRPNTALAFVAAGLALWLLHSSAADRRLVYLKRASMVLLLLIGLLTLSQYAFGWNLGIDQLIFKEDPGAGGTHPGRMAFITAANFSLLAVALLLLDNSRRYGTAQSITLAAFIFGLLGLIGYMYGVEPLYQIVAATSIAAHTALAFVILGGGILLARPNHGWMAIVSSDGAGGALARRMLPAVIIVPIVLGWLRLYFQSAGLFDSAFGAALFVIANILTFSALIVWSAHALYRVDQARQQAELSLRRLNAELDGRVAERTAQLSQANAQLQREAAERERTQAALRESSKRYQSYFESSLLGVLLTAPDGRILEANPETCRLLGWSVDELRQLGRAAVVDVTDPRLAQALDERARTGKFKGEITMIRRGGARFPAEVFTAIYRDEAGAEFSSMMIIDVTERRLAEDALRDSEAKLRALFAAVPVGITVLDAQRRIVDLNPAVERILAMSRTELTADAHMARTYLREDGSLMPRGEIPSVQAIETQQPVLDRVIGVVLESGQTVWTSVSAVPVKGVSPGVVVVTADITDRRQMQAALAQERDLLQALLDNMPDSIFFKDAALRFTRINMAQAQVLGLGAPADAYGKTDADFAAHAQAAQVMAEEQQVIETGALIIDREELRPLPDGQPRWFSATKAPLTDRHGQVRGLIGIARDITPRVLAEEGQRRANASLTQRVEQMSLLHDLEDLLQSCLTVTEAYQATAKIAAVLFPEVSGALYVINNSRSWVGVGAVWGAETPAVRTFGLDDCWAIRRGRPHRAGLAQPAQLFCPHLAAAPPKLSVCIPMLAQGETLGIFHLSAGPDAAAHCLDDDCLQLARVVADSVALALANLKLRERLSEQAIRDPLTGLYNRRYMEESFDRELLLAARRGRPVGVLMIDIDHFKQVNDLFGHAAGDSVLRWLGRYLADSTRGGDIACRYGGEEFVLILPDANLQQTCLRAEQLRQGIAALAIRHGEQAMPAISASIGVASYPEHGATSEALLRMADAGLYRAKREGRNRVAAG